MRHFTVGPKTMNRSSNHEYLKVRNQNVKKVQKRLEFRNEHENKPRKIKLQHHRREVKKKWVG